MPAPSAAPPIDSDCFALLDDCHATAAAPSSRLYGGLVRVHRCADPSTLEAMWAAVDADLRAGLHAGGFGMLAKHEFDLVINATSASLSDQSLPLPQGVFAAGSLAYDMVYGKGTTRFLADAREQGAALLSDGLGMLVAQAAESFRLWRGVMPDIAPVMAMLRGD